MTSIQYEHLRHLIEKMMAYYSIPGMAIGIVDGDHGETMSFGWRNRKGDPFTADTIRWRSISPALPCGMRRPLPR